MKQEENTSETELTVTEVVTTEDEKQISKKKRLIEQNLRDAGCSNKQALDAVHAIFRSESGTPQSDSEDGEENKPSETKSDDELAEFAAELRKKLTE
jgi:hypothetical protein